MRPETWLPKISNVTLRLFGYVVRSYFRRHFRSVMVQHAERLERAQGPLVVYMNHSSWWDPMVSILLAQTMLPDRRHYGPMDAVELARYPILQKIGIFPVEVASARGAAQFLRVTQAILGSGGILWLTPQGRFSDIREEPLHFRSGLAAIAKKLPGTRFFPLAIEYTFWNERLPEVVLRFGEGIHVDTSGSAKESTEVLEGALRSEMLALKTASCARDASAFRVLLSGTRGAGGFYERCRRVRSLIKGKAFESDHTYRER
jgi:1-acyl-sn-glycerol-3-phosphate acyltransferase